MHIHCIYTAYTQRSFTYSADCIYSAYSAYTVHIHCIYSAYTASTQKFSELQFEDIQYIYKIRKCIYTAYTVHIHIRRPHPTNAYNCIYIWKTDCIYKIQGRNGRNFRFSPHTAETSVNTK
jgi:hypothetical protein